MWRIQAEVDIKFLYLCIKLPSPLVARGHLLVPRRSGGGLREIHRHQVPFLLKALSTLTYVGKRVKRGIAVNEYPALLPDVLSRRQTRKPWHSECVCWQSLSSIMFWYPRFSYHEGVFLVNEAIFLLIGNLLETRNTWDSVVVCMSFGIHCWECHGKILTQFYYEDSNIIFW